MRNAVIWLWMSLVAPLGFGAQSIFDPSQNIWTLSNGWIRAAFQLTPNGYFLTQQISDFETGDQWTPAPNQPTSPVWLQVGTNVFNAQRPFLLLDQYTQAVSPSGMRQYIVLQDLNSPAQITVILEVYDNQPVLRYSLLYRNPAASPVYVGWINMLPWTFDGAGQRYTAFRVNQWSVAPLPEDFEPLETVLDPSGASVEVYSGADGQQCGWLALRDPNMRGLFAGWEFDGRVKTTVGQPGSPGNLQFSSTVLGLNHPVPPFGSFQTPYAFLGLFHGGWDEAGYRTQRFSEAVLAKPPPDAKTFPWVSWDSWAYQEQIDEQTLMSNADVAASVGVELFVVDLGWARAIGDWYEDPVKFPHGLAAVSAYVHSLGMKFGLHFALAEADPASPVLQANPDWTSTENDGYFGASSLCLSNLPTQEWLIQQGIRIIDQYNVDWILQDGQNMVKQCTKTTHTHDPNDSNYANAVDGLNAVVSAIQAARPNVFWENCENGGNMMTFNMVKSYVTSIANDASGAFDSRRAVYGATYPFPPRFAERYMPGSDGLTSYSTGSYMFGGPWVLMDTLADLTPAQVAFLGQQIGVYKSQRADIADAMVYHILPPAAGGIDVIQSYNPATDDAVAVVTRAEADSSSYIFCPLGLVPDRRYTVSFENDPSVYFQTGSQLMQDGVEVPLPTPYSSDIVRIQHQ